MALSGSCEFCGQSMVISEEKFPLVDPDNQAEVDAAVTSICDCPKAKSERRKAETAKKIEEYINSEVNPEAKEIVKAAVDAVRGFYVEAITILDKDGWKTKISIDKDGYLVFDVKKTISKKSEF